MRTALALSTGLFALVLAPPAAWTQQEASSDVVAVAPDGVVWQASEEGYRMAVLYGDPAAAGPYVLRFELPPNWAGRPHTHGGTEIVTVHSGTMYFAYGEDLGREAAHALPAGAFIALPAGTPMRPYTGDEQVVVDVHGQGPFTTEYLDE